MDWASIAGILLAFFGLLFGQLVEGAHPSSMLQPAAFLIVFCGTMGAVLLQSRLPTFVRGVRMLRSIFQVPIDNHQKLVREALAWNMSARREGVLSLERYLRAVQDPFISKGLRMVIDGVDAVRIKEILEVDITAFEIFQRQAVRIWESAGGYSPTIGILGAVLGLIHVMENLSDPSKLGSGIAVAFVATIYGVGLANLVFLPIAHKLKEIVTRDIEKKEMLADIFYSIAAGENSRVIEERVVNYE
ncbi:flagellar motor protein [Solimicrobium silvestre]|uniref:Flagellar motor component n=1 Tax=Solimicrobium silvestre TaxID=2099400 RepID=A0A2S9GVU9_9BURK|nr:flagellar motor protein [Solimicrobium silvestre]PRC91849.1 Flagellar motor component [Solimicrobium silvestre]